MGGYFLWGTPQFLQKDNKYYVKRTNLSHEQAEQVPLFTLSKHDYDSIAGVKLTDFERVESNETADQAKSTEDREKTDK